MEILPLKFIIPLILNETTFECKETAHIYMECFTHRDKKLSKTAKYSKRRLLSAGEKPESQSNTLPQNNIFLYFLFLFNFFHSP